MRRATQLFGICWLLCLLAACGESHFMTDASYRSRVEQDFQQKKALMPQGELFTILDDAYRALMSRKPWNSFMPICHWRILLIIPVNFT